MTDERWLREGLADAVPEAPQAPGRAQAARERASRARRRTATAVLAGTAAVVAIGVVGAIAFQRDPGSTGPAGPTASDTSPYDAPACPPPPRPGGPSDKLDRPDPDLPDAVPDGATSVRLCQGEGTSFDVPEDALVTDVDAMVGSVDSLAKVPPPNMCRADLGPGYRLVFDYPDGTRFVASGQLYGCGAVVVGSGYRGHAEIPFNRFVDLLRAQRETAEPLSTPPADVSCDQGPSSPIAHATDLAVAALCLGDRGVAISADDLARLRDDMQANRSDHTDPGCLGPASPSLVGFSAWGDRIEIQSTCTTISYALPEGYYWTPSQEAQEVLNTLVARVRAAPNTE